MIKKYFLLFFVFFLHIKVSQMGQKVIILHDFKNRKLQKTAREPLVPPAEQHLQIRKAVNQRVLSVFLQKIKIIKMKNNMYKKIKNLNFVRNKHFQNTRSIGGFTFLQNKTYF